MTTVRLLAPFCPLWLEGDTYLPVIRPLTFTTWICCPRRCDSEVALHLSTRTAPAPGCAHGDSMCRWHCGQRASGNSSKSTDVNASWLATSCPLSRLVGFDRCSEGPRKWDCLFFFLEELVPCQNTLCPRGGGRQL